MKCQYYMKLGIVSLSALLLASCDLTGAIDQTVGHEDASQQPEAVLDSAEANLNSEQVTVDSVVDGDTVRIINQLGEKETVRMLLIDTPESVHPTEPEPPYGKAASDYLASIISQGDTITLERGEVPTDKYDRTLGYLFIESENGPVNINQLMIEQGYARVAYVYEPNTKYLDDFETAEMKAGDAGLNIWQHRGYVSNQGFDPSFVDVDEE